MMNTTTTRTITIEQAEDNLRSILNALSEDESITVVDEAGAPVAQISAPENGREDLKQKRRAEMKDWIDQMTDVARRIDEAWIGEKSALEQLQEDRSRLDDLADSEDH